ncbi:outer membrane protein assembly factor BamB family protein [Haloferax volcanii]|uniref:PQQ-binding-like beta-propeller repeat protein n=2 Tax=Haloferax volcanii TaxID=2246 RepID=A0A558FZR8_HALVO|nr:MULTISPECIES: PQQ-binding-like beta-propeller repeat protein [Haloferax]ELZ90796.1 PQQ repeat-containing protein [Haloferax alexandrinus JCM 10717]NLV01105.1 PQQ-binding-like beta-propeller repeat protein [Haloferax alexandrinus]TVT91013.1 PQQ-binding-like beta-propeller repeat protein [Haloferax volcanii]
MPRLRSRRRFLQLLGSASFGVAGCLGRDGGSSGPTTTEATTTTAEPSTTYGPTSGPDERVTATPPGDPALSPSGAWPQYRFDAGNTGYNPDVSIPTDAEEYWRLNAGGSPVLDGDRLYNLHGRGRDERAFVRRDPSTMGERAVTPLVGYGVNSPPVVAGDRVVVTTFIEVFCLAADRDEVLWRGPEMDGIHGPPAVGDGVAVVSGGGFDGVPTQLRAFELADGSERWRYDLESDAKGAPAVADGAVFVVTSDAVHAVDLATGERRFRVEARTSEWTTPVATPEAAYLPTRDGELLSLAPSDGTERWRSPGSGAPVVTDDVLHVAVDGETATLSRDDGKEVATRFFGAPHARAREALLVSDEQGRLAAYNTDEERQLWTHQTPEVQVADVISQGVAAAVPVDGAVYVVAADGFHGLGAAQD